MRFISLVELFHSADGAVFFGGVMQKTSINVVAVTIAAKNAPVMLTATLTDNALHVISCTTLPRSIQKTREKLVALAARAKEKNLTLFIEDPTALLSGLGYGVRLDDKTTDGRPVLALSMERYKSLTSMGGILFPDGAESEFTINDSMLNVKVTDTGKTVYEIDWPQLKDSCRALLIAIYGAMCQNPTHEAYLEMFFSLIGTTAESDPLYIPLPKPSQFLPEDNYPVTAGTRKGWL